MPGSIRTEKIRDRITSRLQSYIESNQLKAGDRLPTETQLASQFGVSRLSVREATKTLEFLGIVTSKPGLGLSVGQVDLVKIGEIVGAHPSVQAAPAKQLIETRIVVETGVLPHVMQRMTNDPAVHAGLQAIVERMRKARRLQDFISIDVEFHRHLVAASQLSPLLAINELLIVFFREFRDSVKKAQRLESIESHQSLIDLLRDRKLDAACESLREHIESHLHR
jgi:GntR family transcriptional repressor for pyruvate dehydrogenase complex